MNKEEAERFAERQEYPIFYRMPGLGVPVTIPGVFNQVLEAAYEHEKEETKLSKLKDKEEPTELSPYFGLTHVSHDLTFQFDSFSPEALLEVKNLYGVPDYAEYYFYQEVDEDNPDNQIYVINVTWSEEPNG